MFLGPDKRRLLVRRERVAWRRRHAESEKPDERPMNGRIRLQDSALCVKIQTGDRMLEQIQVAVGVHRRHADPEESAALR